MGAELFVRADSPVIADAAKSGRLNAIQILRGLAALFVVITHVFDLHYEAGGDFLKSWPALHDAGRIGVDIFFVISGFVIAGAALRLKARDWRKFALDRIIRIYPLWIALLTAYYAVFVFLGERKSSLLLLTDYLLIPFPWGTYRMPLLEVGWTLNFEAVFYLLFTVALCINFSRPLIVMAALFLAGFFLRNHGGAFLTLVGNPLVWEFMLGCLLFHLFQFSQRPCFPAGWGAVGLLLVALGLCALGSIEFSHLTETKFAAAGPLKNTEAAFDRLLFLGLPAGFLVWTALQLESFAAKGSVFIRLGDISYSVYLMHAVVIAALTPFALKYSFLHGFPALLLVVLVFTIGLSFVTYLLIEVRFGRFLKRHLEGAH